MTIPTAGCAAFVDDAGQRFDASAAPLRVVSLLPSVTEVVCALGASDSLVGVTYHDTHDAGLAGVAVVGGAFTPQFDRVRGLEPDLLIVAPRDLEKARAEREASRQNYQILVIRDNVLLAESEERIGWLGAVFGRADRAREIVGENRAMLGLIAEKTARIPADERLRVMHVTASDGVLSTSGTETFQGEYIAAAGGIGHGVPGAGVVPVTPELWRSFAPQAIYTCDTEIEEVKRILSDERWADMPAVEGRRIYAFPCSLVCRAATHTGYFVAWLSSMIYTDTFADETRLVYPQEVLSERTLELDIPYVRRARIVDSRIMDFVHRSLLVDFKTPQTIASTVEGGRPGVATVGNSFSPTPTWSIYHQTGFEHSREVLYSVLGIDKGNSELMFTGADMNNLSVRTASYRDMKVTALVTAGVEGNALRTAKDEGRWYEPGTINVLVMTNHHLSPQAATRAIVTATEAKTAALWDMDIRSVQTPLENPATGTGTDTVIVVAGEGATLNWSGGHSKMGELIAEAVYAGVQEALLKQNGKTPVRNIFARLAERGLSPHGLMAGPDFSANANRRTFQADLERILLTPRYAGFLESALSQSDAHGMGQVSDLGAFESWARLMAEEIAGCPVSSIERVSCPEGLPPALRIALDAVGTGLKYRRDSTER